jgi:hypothetical protein
MSETASSVAKLASLLPGEKDRLVDRIKHCLRSITHNVIDTGRMLAKLRDGSKHGEWLPLLKRIGIAERTAYNYIDAFKESQQIPADVKTELKRAAVPLSAKPVREKVAQVQRDNPQATAREIVAAVQSTIKQQHDQEQDRRRERSKPGPAYGTSYKQPETVDSPADAVEVLTKQIREVTKSFSAPDKEFVFTNLIRILQSEMNP